MHLPNARFAKFKKTVGWLGNFISTEHETIIREFVLLIWLYLQAPRLREKVTKKRGLSYYLSLQW